MNLTVLGRYTEAQLNHEHDGALSHWKTTTHAAMMQIAGRSAVPAIELIHYFRRDSLTFAKIHEMSQHIKD